MKTRISNHLGVVGLSTVMIIIVVTLFLGGNIQAQASAKPSDSKTELVGTWRMKISLYDCNTGKARPPFDSMVSFAEGGVLTDTTANPAIQPAQRSPGHGIWTNEGKHTYRFISDAYILFASAPNPPAPGLQKGIQRITQTVKVNGDQLTTDGPVEFFDVAGNLLVKGCGKSVGERMKP